MLARMAILYLLLFKITHYAQHIVLQKPRAHYVNNFKGYYACHSLLQFVGWFEKSKPGMVWVK